MFQLKDTIIAWIRFIRLLAHVITGLIKLKFYFRNSNTTSDYRITSQQQQRIIQWHTKLLNILNIKMEIQNKKESSSVFIICNHISWLDIPVLGSQTAVRFIAKDEIASWPVINTMVLKTGNLFIKRGKPGELKKLSVKIDEIIKDKGNIALFPEGKTTDGQQIENFYPGLFQNAIDNKITIQPLLLIYSDSNRPSRNAPYINDQNLWDSLWCILKTPQIRVAAHWCEPIPASGQDRKQLAQLSHAVLVNKLKEEL